MIAIEDQHWTGFTDGLRRASGPTGAVIDNPSYPYKDEETNADVGRKRRPQIHDAGGGGGGLPAPNRNAGGKMASARKDARLGGAGGGRGGRLSASSGSTIVASKNMGQGEFQRCSSCSF